MEKRKTPQLERGEEKLWSLTTRTHSCRQKRLIHLPTGSPHWGSHSFSSQLLWSITALSTETQSKIPMLGRKQCSDARSPTQLPQQILLTVQDIHWSPLTSHNYLQFQCLRRLSTINLTKSGSDSSNNVQSYQFSSGLNFTLFFVKRVPQYPATVLIYQCWLHL